MDRRIRILDCKECGYTWPSTSDEAPKVCPKCKTKYWEQGKIYTYGNTVYDLSKFSDTINTYRATNNTSFATYRDVTGMLSSCKTDSSCQPRWTAPYDSSTQTTTTTTATTIETKKKKEEKEEEKQ